MLAMPLGKDSCVVKPTVVVLGRESQGLWIAQGSIAANARRCHALYSFIVHFFAITATHIPLQGVEGHTTLNREPARGL